MPLFPILIAGGSIFAWESLFGGAEENSSLLSWNNVLKIAMIAGAVYFAAKAFKGAGG